MEVGNGLVTLSGSNTFTGNVVVSGGTLQANFDPFLSEGSRTTGLGNLTTGKTITVGGGASSSSPAKT